MIKQRAIISTICGLEAAAAVYAIIRIIQVFTGNEPNPATVIHSIHAGFFWRAWIAAYAGGFVSLTTFILTRNPDRLEPLARRALPWAAGLLAAQALIFP